MRAAAHEDINLITVLPAGSARGLQLKSRQSGEWYEVPLVEGSIVINVGDMMQVVRLRLRLRVWVWVRVRLHRHQRGVIMQQS